MRLKCLRALAQLRELERLYCEQKRRLFGECECDFELARLHLEIIRADEATLAIIYDNLAYLQANFIACIEYLEKN